CSPADDRFGSEAVAATHVRFGSQADVRTAKRHVRFAPNSDHESDFSQKPMSALPPKADMCGCKQECPLRAKSGHVISRLSGEVRGGLWPYPQSLLPAGM